MSEQSIERRGFLKTGLATAAGTALAATAQSETANSAESKPRGLPTRPFGKTGIDLPIFGMGGSAMVDKWAASYGVRLGGKDDRISMVRHAYERGLRYFDTARVYGESESIMGQALKKVRDNVFIATKVAVFRPEDVRKSLETSLTHLETDHADLVQVHSPTIEAIGFKKSMKIQAELIKLRDEGLLRFIGLTTHVAYEDVYKMICTQSFDQVLLAYGYFRKGMDTLLSNRNLEFRQLCLDKAHELKMAIVAMKVMGASIFGHNANNLVPSFDADALERLPAAAIRWVLQDERISLLNIGISEPKDIDKNISVLSSDLAFTNRDRKLLADFSQRAYQSDSIRQMRTV